jgi:hypothetical protein
MTIKECGLNKIQLFHVMDIPGIDIDVGYSTSRHAVASKGSKLTQSLQVKCYNVAAPEKLPWVDIKRLR